MEKIIGYKQAKALMLDGCKVQESTQIRGSNIARIKTADGELAERIRSDMWDKLRKECRLVETLHDGLRGQNRRYIWELRQNG